MSRNTRIIAVTSGKGGVGKTSLSLNLAISIAKTGASVTLLDADLGLANSNIMLGVSPEKTLKHVINGDAKLKDIIIETPEGINLVPGASGVFELANLDAEKRSRLINSFTDIKDDYLILDTGAGISQNVLKFLMASDEVIIVTTPEPTSIADAYGIIKYLKTQSYFKDVRLVVNKIKSLAEGRRIVNRINNVTKEYLNCDIEALGFIYEDSNVTKSINAQKPFIIKYPKSKASGCVAVMAANLINKSSIKGSGVKSFFKKLTKAS